MKKILAFMALFCITILHGCGNETITGEIAVNLEALQDIEETEYYANLIEKTISLDKYSGMYSFPKGKKRTDIYYDNDGEIIYFFPEESKYLYYLASYTYYERYTVSRSESSDNIYKILSSPACKWIGEAIINYDVEMNYQLPELCEEDFELVDKLIEYVQEQFSMRQEHFCYDVYLGDYLKETTEEPEHVAMALAVIGEENYFIWAELTKEDDEYGIWMFPSPFGLPDKTVLDTRQFHDDKIENILEFGELVGHIEK